MARTNVEERFFANDLPRKIARRVKQTEQFVIGAAVYLWHDSQAEGRTSGNAEEIQEWTRIRNSKTFQKILDAFEKFQIISANPGGNFDICGNESQIISISRAREGSAKGGESTKKRWEQIKLETKLEAKPRAMPEPSLEASSIQFNSIQSNSIHNPPLSPFTKGDEKLIASLVIGAARKGIQDEGEARAYLRDNGAPEGSYELVMKKFSSWTDFFHAHMREYLGNKGTYFENNLLNSLKVFIERSGQ